MSPTKDYFPLSGYTKSFWLSQEDNEEFSTHRSTIALPTETDVLIIGSGYAGTSTAHYLLEQDPSLKVALYEARTVCSGATGRNGGHVKPYFHRNYDYYESMLGQKGAAEVVNSEYEHLWTIKKLVDDYNIDCDFFLTRACDVYPLNNDPRIDKDLAAAKKMLSNPFVYPEMKKQFQVFHGEQARIISKNPETDIAFTYPAASCWPWKLMSFLLKMCVGKGLNLQTNTLVTSVTPNGDGRWQVQTKDHGITVCKKVVFCTNGYTKGLLEQFSNVIVPQKAVCCSIEASDKTHIPHLTNTYGFFTSQPNSDYLINRPDGTIIVGGRDDCMITDSDLTGFFDCVDDTFVPEVSNHQFKSYMKTRFTSWENTESDVSKIWSGILGFTNDFLPYVGELDIIGMNNCYIAAGFHGHGMPRVLLSGKAVATCITREKKIHELEYIIPRGFFATKQRLEKENLHEKQLKDYAREKFGLNSKF